MTFIENRTDRRTVVAGAAAVGMSLLTTACGSGTTAPAGSAPATTAGSDPTSAPPTSAAAPPTAAPPTAAPTTAAPAPASHGVPLGKAAAVPVGGGTVFAAAKVVVTQPRAGTFVGLSAVCTHQGCVVGEVSGGTINCPCHGSRYHLDGSVAKGPATRALAHRAVTVTAGEIELR